MVMSLRTSRASVAGGPPSWRQRQSRPVPTVALVGLDNWMSEVMSTAFAECAVKTVEINDDFARLVAREKFEGCALPLNDRAPSILKAIRSSPSNSRMIVYGVGSEDLDVRPFASYGINAVLDLFLDRTAALRTARSTCALLLQELRRYVRIPLVTDVSVETAEKQLRGSSREISGGGMSVHVAAMVIEQSKVRLTFTLPGTPLIRILAAVCWKQDSQIGFQFEDLDASREIVKNWIEWFCAFNR